MQFILKQNASDLYWNIEKLGQSADQLQLETLDFIKKNNGKPVFVHGANEEKTHIYASQYENWKKYELPVELFEDKTQEDDDGAIEDGDVSFDYLDKVKNFLRNPKKMSIFAFIILFIVFVAFNQKKEEKPAPAPVQVVQEKPKSVFENLADKQSLNLKKISAKMETQKIIKSQIKDLQTKLDHNINEIKALELENSNIREQMIDETSNFTNNK